MCTQPTQITLRKNLKFLCTIALIVTFSLCGTLHAQTSTERKETWTFANCHLVDQDLSQSAGNVDSSKRQVAMEQLLKDLRKIFNERMLTPGLSPYTPNFLKNCFRKKNQALVEYGRNAPESFKDSVTYFRIFAQESFLNAQLASGAVRIERYKKAEELLSEVLKRDPKDWSAKEDRFRAYVFYTRYKWDLSDTTGASKLPKNSISATELQEYRKKSVRLIQDIIKDPEVSAEKKISCYKFLIANTESMMMRNNETVADWKKILELNAKDSDALTSLGNYYFKHGQHKEALPYFERLSALNPESELVASLYFECLYRARKFDRIRFNSAAFKKRFPKNAALFAVSARANLELKSFAEAKSDNKKALKLDPRNKLARATQSIFLERDADGALEKNLLSSALQTYEKAYKLDPSRPALRTKMAKLIYKYRSEKNFKPVETAKTEMSQIVELLYDLAKTPESRPLLKEEGVEILVEASSFIKSQKKLLVACRAYEEMLGIISKARLQKICGEAYARAGDRAKSQELLSLALEKEKVPSEKQRIIQMLNRIR